MEPIGGFATGWVLVCLFWRRRVTDFEITCVMRVFGRVEEAQASIRACRFEPLPEIRTTML